MRNSFEGAGRWVRGALAGAALAVGSGHNAEAAVPTHAVEHAPETEGIRLAKKLSYIDEKKTKEIMKAWGITVGRDEILLNQETGVGSIKNDGVQNKEIIFDHRGEETVLITIIQADDSRQVIEIFRGVFRQSGITESAPEVAPEPVPLADKIIFQNERETKKVMEKWGISTDGFVIKLDQDPRHVEDPIRAIDPNDVVTFNHIGDDTIVISFVGKDGSRGSVLIRNGKEQI